MKNRFLNLLVSLVYPTRCIVCREVIKPGGFFCPKCEKDFIYTPKDYSYFEHSKLSRIYFDDLISPAFHEEGSRAAVYNMKFHGMKNAFEFFSKEITKAFQNKYSDNFDYVIYVPTTKERLKKRGYNPPQILAENFSRNVGVPIIHDSFIRRENSKTQHSLSFFERQTNADESYSLNMTFPENSSFILIDDICTTGATLNSISRLLKEKGAGKIVCLTATIGVSGEK